MGLSLGQFILLKVDWSAGLSRSCNVRDIEGD